MSEKQKLGFSLTLCVYFLAFTSASHAADGVPNSHKKNPSLVATIVISAGVSYQQADAKVSSRNKISGNGGSVDLSDLGAKEEHVSPDLRMRWRFSDRWHLDLGYQNLLLDGRRGASSQINFGDISIPVGWSVATDLEVDLFSIAVGYSFFRNDHYDFGGLLGLDVLSASAEVSGSIGVGNLQTTRSAKISATVPIPTIGLYGTVALSDRLALQGNVKYLYADVAGYRGDIFMASAEAKYWLTQNMALGVGYRHTAIDFKHESARSSEAFKFDFGGPYAAVSISF